MTDAQYDAVVIGGGHHGTIIACYLARSNMHSGSGIGRGSSVNCWNTIAADLALDPG